MDNAGARTVARRWLADSARTAFLTGSAVARPLDAPHPASSDIDVVLVGAGRAPGKVLVDGVLLDVSSLPGITAEQAASWVFAPSFVGDHALADPTGRLAALRRTVEPGFATPDTVARRVDGVVAAVRHRLRARDPGAPWATQVRAWLFPASLTTHVPLIAALRSPTVRLRYQAVREIVDGATFDALLDVLGARHAAPDAVRHHVDVLAGVVAPLDRPGVVDGSRTLIDAGEHREAAFGILAGLTVAGDDRAVRAAADDLLGVRGPADLARRSRTATDLAGDLRLRCRAAVSGRSAPQAVINPGQTPVRPSIRSRTRSA